MPRLFGRTLSRTELMRSAGDVSQFGGIRPVRLQDGFEDQVRALEFRTGAGLEFDILTDRGFDISRASYKGVPLAWRSAQSDRHSSYYDAAGAGWLRSFFGGLLTTCGLTQVGAPCVDNGQELGVHGRISSTPAFDVCVRHWWEGDEYLFEASGKMRESVVFGENLLLERTVATALGNTSLTLRDTVTNEGWAPAPHMILYHINLGYPVVDAGSRIYAPSAQSTPRDAEAENEADKWQTMLPPTAGFAERVYFHQMSPDDTGYVTVALVNEALGSGPLGVYVRYKADTLPRFAEWKMNGAGDYVCGLEPANCSVLGRAAEREAGTLVVLEPGETREYEIEIGVIDGRDELEKAKELAEVNSR